MTFGSPLNAGQLTQIANEEKGDRNLNGETERLLSNSEKGAQCTLNSELDCRNSVDFKIV